MVSPTLTIQGFSVFRIDWPARWQSLLHLLTVFHCFVSFIWLPVRFRILFKINLLTYKTLHEKQPVYLPSILAASLPSCSLTSDKNDSLSVLRVKTNTGARAFHSCAPCLWNNLQLAVRSATAVATFKRHLKTSLWLGLSPIGTSMPDGLLMLQNCFFNFAVEHWFSCRATEPGFTGDISTIEIWLIDLGWTTYKWF